MISEKEILLEINNLAVSTTEKEKVQNLIKRISFKVKRNEIVGLIGESGSGKSLTSLCILGLLEKNKFNIQVSGDYDVANQFSQTLTNEKRIIETLTDKIAEKITDNLILKVNDI